MKTKTPLRLRISRFLSDRYAQRERPDHFPDLAVFAIVVMAAAWPVLSLVYAMGDWNWIATLERIWF